MKQILTFLMKQSIPCPVAALILGKVRCILYQAKESFFILRRNYEELREFEWDLGFHLSGTGV